MGKANKDAEMLERCRAVEYTKGPAGRKGSRKCAECGFYFVPSEEKHPFYDVDGPPPDGTAYRTGVNWYEETGCCPNCDPLGTGQRRCLGMRNISASRWIYGCGDWFDCGRSRYMRGHELSKRNRRQVCPNCVFSSPQTKMKDRLLIRGYELISELGRAPTAREWVQRGIGDGRLVASVFGSYNAFISELGQPIRQRGGQKGHVYPNRNSSILSHKYTIDEMIALMRAEATKHGGRALTVKEWKRAKIYPCAATIAERLGNGNWRMAWQRLGYDGNPSIRDGFSSARELSKKGIVARYGSDAGKKAYEILDDPDSEYNRQQREIAAKQAHYEREMAEAVERFENAKFRPKHTEDEDTLD